MKYVLRISASTGDIVPLACVADVKAHQRATAGGTGFHEPAYQGSLIGFAGDLLREARSGSLKVCDQWGSPGDADALLAEAERAGHMVVVSRYLVEPDWARLQREHETVAPGVWHLAHLDLGPMEVDWTRTHLGVLSTTLNWLNAWAMDRGDEFSIDHEGIGWGDERGWNVGLTETAPVSQTQTTVDANVAPKTSLTHRVARDLLTPLLDSVYSTVSDPSDSALVMAELERLARLPEMNRPAPLAGVTSGGVQWRDGGAVNTLTRKALGDRMRRRAQAR